MLLLVDLWADREGRKIRLFTPFHYVDVSRGANSYDRQRDCPNGNCIVEAIAWYLHVVALDDAPLNEKQIALNFLAHLAGDIHQPLHVGFTDELGGTKLQVSFQGKQQTLHELWDTGLIETEKGSAKEIAKRLDEKVSAEDRKSWEAGTPTDWANESLALTASYVYPLPESHQISEEYAKRALPILHKRLAQAGVRLAWLLNEALGE
jgi:S1/P1 Nuclease